MSKGRIDSGQMKLGEILVARSLITRNQLQSALEQQKTSGKGGSVRFKVRRNSQGVGHTPPAEAGPTGADPRRSNVPRARASGPRHILKLEARRDGSSEGFGGDRLQRWMSTRIADSQLPRALSRGRRLEIAGVTERRSSVRVPLQRPQRLYLRLLGGAFEGAASDLGEDGMFVYSGKPHREGTRVEFEFRFADEIGFVEGLGQVTWVSTGGSKPPRGSGMGIRFLDFHGDGQEVVRLAVRQR